MKYNEKAFLNLVSQGVYKLYRNGKIYRVKKANTNGNGEYRKCEPVLMDIKCSKDYIQIAFKYQRKQMYILVSRAIWIYFNGGILKNLEMNHKNGIKDDNRLSNLELVTRSGNMIHAYENGLKDACGENNGNHKLKNRDILKIRKLIKKGIKQNKIAKMFNVGSATISYINGRKIWA